MPSYNDVIYEVRHNESVVGKVLASIAWTVEHMLPGVVGDIWFSMWRKVPIPISKEHCLICGRYYYNR